MTIEKNQPTSNEERIAFQSGINFSLPEGLMEFYTESNGAIIITEERYTVVWPLTELKLLNEQYKVEEYAPEFFIFGSDGGDMAFGFEIKTGYFYELPFIGMSREESSFISKTFQEFLNSL